MSERYDVKQMLLEIKADEKLYRAKPVLLTQQEIDALRAQLRQAKRPKESQT